MAKFYAVKEGKKPGIYHTWDECKEQVNGYSGAVYKSFTNEEEAKAFIKKEERKQKIAEALDQVGLKGMEKKKVYQCSGGEQQRIALARLLIKPCQLILADEPTGNLDYENKEKVFNLLKAFNQNGKTVIIVTHDIELAKKCHKIYQMDQGKLSNYAN